MILDRAYRRKPTPSGQRNGKPEPQFWVNGNG